MHCKKKYLIQFYKESGIFIKLFITNKPDLVLSV